MDNDGFPLAVISDKSTIIDDDRSIKPMKRGIRAVLRGIDSNGGIENGDISNSKHILVTNLDTSIYSEQRSNYLDSPKLDQMKKSTNYDVNSLPDDSDPLPMGNKTLSEQPSQILSEQDNTMLSSYTAGSGENDVIEIHQFSAADIDAYLDIYFDTLNNRLRHYIGQDEPLRQFRAAMKNRISSNSNAREYQNVLLGKMNGEVLAAVTMSFPGELPTIPLSSETPERDSCFTSIHRWMARKSNYVPTNMEECYIEMLGVKNEYQNHGIGSAMLECVEHFARQAGAKLLTIHVNGPRLRNYFERYGFHLDSTDNSAFWKWIVERQSSTKLSKPLPTEDDNNDFAAGSYINESMVESIEE